MKFNADDIDDVRVLIRVKGKHYSVVPDRDISTDEEAKNMRLSALSLILLSHKVVDTPLEELKEKLKEK